MLKSFALALLGLIVSSPGRAQEKPTASITTMEGLSSAIIELVGKEQTVKVEANTFINATPSTWMAKGRNAEVKAPKGLHQVRLGTINVKKVFLDFILVKMDTRRKGDYRYYAIEGAPRGSKPGEMAPQVLFNPFQTPLFSFKLPPPTPHPVLTDDGSYVINLPQPLEPGHYAVVLGLFFTTTPMPFSTQNPTIPGWDFDAVE